MSGNIFLQLSALLAITVSLAFLIRLLRQPLIIAYIIAGMVCGPLFFNFLGGGEEVYKIFSEFGIVLLLFVIGLNLNFTSLRGVGKISLISGIGQLIFTGVIGTLLLVFLKISVLSAIYLAVATTFSSTVIIMKLLTDKKDTETIYGKYTIGLMLVQDVIAILIMVFLGLIKYEESWADSLFFLVAKGVVIVAIIFIISRYLLPKFLDRISHSSELLFIFTVTWCFGVASLLYLAGFSLEIGAIAAGLSLGSSPYQKEIASRIKPLRDFFLVLFFIVLGSEMSLNNLREIWLPGLSLSLFILVGNPIILYFIFRLLKFTRRNSFLSGLTAAQVSEFGFVLLFSGEAMGHLRGSELSIFTMVAIITIFISSYLILYNESIYRWLLQIFNKFGKDKNRQTSKPIPVYDAWVIGYHRIGRKVCEALGEMDAKFAVIDFDPEAVRALRHQTIPAYFGDVADVEFLEDLPLPGAKLIIMTIPTTDDQLTLIKQVRKHRTGTLIIANTYQYEDADLLYKAGADYVMMPHLLGGNWIADVLKRRDWNRDSLNDLKKEQLLILHSEHKKKKRKK